MGYYSIVVCGKSKCPGARLDLTVNFHHEHFIDPTNCPWVSEDGNMPDIRDLLNRSQNGPEIISAHSRMNIAEILSSPVAR